jgi:hypothetical protein
VSAAGSLVWKLARACALALAQRDDAVSLTAAFRFDSSRPRNGKSDKQKNLEMDFWVE